MHDLHVYRVGICWFFCVILCVIVSVEVTGCITDSIFLVQLLESFEKSFPELKFPPLPERGDFDLTDVLGSPYFFN